ncbi:MAG: hypothetical protein QOE46_2435 [Acidobacteriota bacterium]|jgi:hypothetical protein|nr:hypothetical protein [Acidobacteriota bacterium]
MPFALLLALAAIAGATILTYLYDRDALFLSRLCAGVCIGFAALGLVGFVLSSLLGMTTVALVLAGAACASPLLLLLRRGVYGRFEEEVSDSLFVLRKLLLRPGGEGVCVLVFYVGAALVFWFVFAHAMYETPGGIFTGVDTNIGDLPFHLAVVTGFAYGDNFPPQHPEFAGVRLTYPFVVDFVTAMFVRAGASVEGAMFWQNFAMMMSLVGLLHRWALKLVRAWTAALLVPLLVLLSGGFGWVHFLGEAWKGERGLFSLLGGLEHDYTIMGHIGYRWGNAVTALFVTQRSIVLGLALALVVWTLWWEASVKAAGKSKKAKGKSEEAASAVESRGVVGKKKIKSKAVRGRASRSASARGAEDEAQADSTFAFCLSPFAFREMLAAGFVAGMMPLVHAHSFVVMMLMGACLALMQGVAVLSSEREESGVEPQPGVWASVWTVWRPWVVFAASASALALPQMFWATRESGARAGQFFGWEFGWDHGTYNVAWFWLKNTAVFIPLLVIAIAWWARERVRLKEEALKPKRGGRGRHQSSTRETPLVSDRLIFFYTPFVLCFIVPNVYKLSPWVWDNIKVLLYWWVASAPLVALVLARLWRRGAAWRAAVVVLVFMQTAAGGLDVWRAASGAVERREFDPEGLAFAEVVRRETGPRSLILHAPTYNDPVYLTGRRSFLGYPGHVWSHGIDYTERESALKNIYAGSPEAPALVESAGIEYVVVGPLEREEMRKYGVNINESFFARYRKVGEAGGYLLYKTKP